jgi:hypothetical protein
MSDDLSVGEVVVLLDMPSLIAAADGDAAAAPRALIVAGPVLDVNNDGTVVVRGQTPAGGPDAYVVVHNSDGDIGAMSMFSAPSLLAAATAVRAPPDGGLLVTTPDIMLLVTTTHDGVAILAPAPADADGVPVTVGNAAAVVAGTVTTKALALCVAAQIAARASGTLQV